MVNRREIESTTPCTVVDLDGTYIDGNTLKIYLLCGIRFLWSHHEFKKLAKLINAVAKRKMKLISHCEMKSTILEILYPYPEILEAFAKVAVQKINTAVKELIKDKLSQGHRILLATAAPAFYVKTIWSDDYVASEFQPNHKLVECMSEEKLRRVKEWLSANHCHLDTVVTDHNDDAPLVMANEAGTNVLVNPSKNTLSFFRQLKPAHLFLIKELGDLSVAK